MFPKSWTDQDVFLARKILACGLRQSIFRQLETQRLWHMLTNQFDVNDNRSFVMWYGVIFMNQALVCLFVPTMTHVRLHRVIENILSRPIIRIHSINEIENVHVGRMFPYLIQVRQYRLVYRNGQFQLFAIYNDQAFKYWLSSNLIALSRMSPKQNTTDENKKCNRPLAELSNHWVQRLVFINSTYHQIWSLIIKRKDWFTWKLSANFNTLTFR